MRKTSWEMGKRSEQDEENKSGGNSECWSKVLALSFYCLKEIGSLTGLEPAPVSVPLDLRSSSPTCDPEASHSLPCPYPSTQSGGKPRHLPRPGLALTNTSPAE